VAGVERTIAIDNGLASLGPALVGAFIDTHIDFIYTIVNGLIRFIPECIMQYFGYL
jgi:hypothetical protein